MQLAYLGPEGTFSEEAARTFAARHPQSGQIQLVPMKDIPDVLYAVDAGTCPWGIVPVENSIEGSVVVTLDLLVHEVDLKIVAEEVLPIRHALLAPPGVTLEMIEKVVSHPQALAQCRQTLNRLVPNAKLEVAQSTAEAARQVAANRVPAAALGTMLAGELYGLQALAHDVQDIAENMTRFLVVGREEQPPSGMDKTSIVFAFEEDRPGNLHAALGAFASRSVNLTRLESRPAKRSLGDYIFFADMEGHQADPTLAEALAEVREMCTFFRILGSYPRTQIGVRNSGATVR